MCANKHNTILDNIFISAPMSSFDKKSYSDSREEIMKIVSFLRGKINGSNIYYAGELLPDKNQFNTGKVALECDTNALRLSTLFLMVYPEKIVSSALIEAGFALAQNIPCLVFTKNSSDLPYLLKSAGEPPALESLPPIAIHEYSTVDDIILFLNDNVLSSKSENVMSTPN